MDTKIERRTEYDGLFILTTRGDRWKSQLAALGLRGRTVVVQEPQLEGGWIPQFRPPMALDTVKMPVDHLVAVLAELQHLQQSKRAQMEDLRVIAIVEADDLQAQRLCALCSVVAIIGADTTAASWLPVWLTHLAAMRKPSARQRMVQCLDVSPFLTIGAVDLEFIPVLAALSQVDLISQVPDHCHVSPRTAHRVIRALKDELGIEVPYARPRGLYETILRSLGMPLPTMAGYSPKMLSGTLFIEYVS